MSGIFISIQRPISLMSTLAAFVARWTVSRPIRLSIPSEALAIVSALLIKTLRSSTFKRALIWIGVFGTIVVVLFGYVYWSTSSYVLSRSDHAIAAAHATLRNAYEAGGRSGLIAAIEQRITDERFQRGLYLLADPSLKPVAGNLK